MLSFLVFEDGKPLKTWPETVTSRAFCIYLADFDNRPLEKSFDFDYAHLISYCPENVSRRLFIRYHVKNFGDPVLRTRMLQSGPLIYNLSLEIALGRMEFLDEQLEKAALKGLSISKQMTDRIEISRTLALKAKELDTAEERANASVFADKSLEISVSAGEALALEVAEKLLTKTLPDMQREGFLLGCNYFTPGSKHQSLFTRLFNFATLPFYLRRMEPEEGTVLHDNVFNIARELKEHNIKLKGHPLVWLFSSALPDHRFGMDFKTCIDTFRNRILRDVPPFTGLIDYWDVINEAHGLPWTNPSGFTSHQMVEISGMAAETCRKAAPGSKTVINVCLPFGEYTAGSPGRVTPLEYVRSCIHAGIDFDVIGIQFYYGSGLMQYCWDMLEISRILDEFAALGKEIHITELGTPSAMGPDPDASIKQGNEVGLWHNEWNEDTQADWVEQFYKICMSKPLITGITWWNFNDGSGIFWPHGGLLDAQGKPKKSYGRLLELKKVYEGK